jgi:hypothetical protein
MSRPVAALEVPPVPYLSFEVSLSREVSVVPERERDVVSVVDDPVVLPVS